MLERDARKLDHKTHPTSTPRPKRTRCPLWLLWFQTRSLEAGDTSPTSSQAVLQPEITTMQMDTGAKQREFMVMQQLLHAIKIRLEVAIIGNVQQHSFSLWVHSTTRCQSLNPGLFFTHTPLDELAFQIRQFRQKNSLITMDIVAMGMNASHALFKRHCHLCRYRPPTLQGARSESR